MKPQAYILDLDPGKAAEMYCDQHVVEDLPMLVEVLRAANVGDPAKEPLCKHVLAKWAMNRENYCWLRKLAMGLMFEQHHRFGIVDQQAADNFWMLSKCTDTIPASRFVQLIDDKIPGDAVSAYRRYYCKTQTGAAWTKRKAPSWWTGVSQGTLNLVSRNQ